MLPKSNGMKVIKSSSNVIKSHHKSLNVIEIHQKSLWKNLKPSDLTEVMRIHIEIYQVRFSDGEKYSGFTDKIKILNVLMKFFFFIFLNQSRSEVLSKYLTQLIIL